MKIRDFGVEIWMNLYENNCTYNLAETCVESLTVEELMTFTDDDIFENIKKMQLTYGAIEGTERLRKAICTLYDHAKVPNLTITHGAIGANDLVLNTLVEPGDTVISVLPTYQQHYSIPESIGAKVKILPLLPENNFLLDLNMLEEMIDDHTKLICINNPNNPTGALMDEAFLQKIVDLAKPRGIRILCDEVYRGINHEGESFTKSIFDLYDLGISTGSMSKAFSLAGLRIGWVCADEEFIELINRRRDYNTISCGKIDDYLAAVALENKDKIITRNLKIVRDNKQILLDWVAKEPLISLVEPKAGTTAFLKYHFDMTSEALCVDLLEKKGVMLLPGSAMDVEGYLRIGYAFDAKVIHEGLEKFSEYLKTIAEQ